MRVNLKEWMRKNKKYVALWITMGLASLVLVIRELGIYTIGVILPFLPPFVVAMFKMAKELK